MATLSFPLALVFFALGGWGLGYVYANSRPWVCGDSRRTGIVFILSVCCWAIGAKLVGMFA